MEEAPATLESTLGHACRLEYRSALQVDIEVWETWTQGKVIGFRANYRIRADRVDFTGEAPAMIESVLAIARGPGCCSALYIDIEPWETRA